jgi:hypothetical protein
MGRVPFRGIDMGCAGIYDAIFSAYGGSQGVKWGLFGLRLWVLIYLQVSSSGADPLRCNGCQVYSDPER